MDRSRIEPWTTQVLPAFEPASSRLPSSEALAAAADWLARSVPVVVPTETVYGLAAPAADRRAVGAVFDIKGRPHDNPLIVHVTREAHLAQVGAVLPPLARKLARQFWPGPLTLVVPCEAELSWVTAGLDSVAVRHPAHPFAAALIERTGALAAPSTSEGGETSSSPSGTGLSASSSMGSASASQTSSERCSAAGWGGAEPCGSLDCSAI